MKFSKMDSVKTVKVTRLHQTQTIADVLVGEKYHAFLQGATAQLNADIFAQLENPQDTNGFKQGAVQITKNENGKLAATYLKGRFEMEPDEVLIADIRREDLNKKFVLSGKIESVKQTGGPTLFMLSDGSATLTIKGFAGAKVRAFPEIDVDAVVSTQVQIIEHEGILEGEIITIKPLSPQQQVQFAEKLKRVLFDRSRPEKVDFLVKSPILTQLKPKMEEAVTQIKMAIADSRPLILKHHADTDGYSAAMALQRAILPLVAAQHNDERALWMYYIRTPSKSPFYDYFDATRDIGHALSDQAKFNQKMPLIIIVDTGSGEEDALPIQKVKLFGCSVIVIDHHIPGKGDPISTLADVHINPHLVGDEYSFSAGMLCTEVARLIKKEAENISYIPALAGLADRIASPELESYLAIAQQQGYSREFLEKLGVVIDFEAWNFRFDESRELVDILFGSNKEQQHALVNLLYPKIQQMFERQLEVARQNAKIETVGHTILATLDIAQSSNFNTYPPAGKTLSTLHDWVQTQHPGQPVLSLGHGNDFITIRATDGVDISIPEFVERMQNKYPRGALDGGGHAHAGSIKCIPKILPDLLAEFKKGLTKS